MKNLSKVIDEIRNVKGFDRDPWIVSKRVLSAIIQDLDELESDGWVRENKFGRKWKRFDERTIKSYLKEQRERLK